MHAYERTYATFVIVAYLDMEPDINDAFASCLVCQGELGRQMACQILKDKFAKGKLPLDFFGGKALHFMTQLQGEHGCPYLDLCCVCVKYPASVACCNTYAWCARSECRLQHTHWGRLQPKYMRSANTVMTYPLNARALELQLL